MISNQNDESSPSFNISSPPRTRRLKRAAEFSPQNQAKYNRDQSAIAKKWWSRKKGKLKALEVKLEQQQQEISALQEDLDATCASLEDTLMEVYELHGVQEELEVARESITSLEFELDELRQLEGKLKAVVDVLEPMGGLKKIDDKRNRIAAISSLLVTFLGVIMKNTHPITRLRAVCEALFENALFGVEATKVVLQDLSQTKFVEAQRKIFSPWKVLRAIDLSIGGCLNYSGVDALRSVEGLGRYQRGILPSRSSVQRASYDLNDFGQDFIPFARQQCHLGECYSFDYEKLIRFVLKTFKLYEIAQTDSVELSFTLDGAELCQGIQHLTAGVKITDSRAIDPKDGTPLCSEGVLGRIFKVQSRNYCFAMKSLLGKDCKAAYKEFSDFFLFFEQLKNYGLPQSELGPALLPMHVWSPQDLSSVWKSLNTGGGARKNGNKYFCHLCPCTGNSIARFSVDNNRCDNCKECDRDRCYHWIIGDEDSIAAFQVELEEQLDLYLQSCSSSLDEIKSRSKIIYDPCDVTRESNIYNIDYIPRGDTDEEKLSSLTFFSNLLSHELQLRKLQRHGTLEERRERLKKFLEVEQKLLLIAQAIARGQEGREAALMLIMQAIPCIMHLENRVGEKLITVLLAIGADIFRRSRGLKSLKRYCVSVGHIVNTQILGTIIRPKQWKVPVDDSGDSISKVSFSNKKTREFVDNIQVLVNHIFLAPEHAQQKQIWTDLLQEYRDAMVILRQAQDYTDDDINEFQRKIDNFYTAYVETSGAGKEGITNYLHMLGSSHISYFMKRHRNLYKFSQQGWESLNEKVKLIFFNHSQRGGNYGKSVEENQRSYLKTIFMCFQRELLWVSGFGDDFFMNQSNN